MSLQAVFTIPDANRSFELLFKPELADVRIAYNQERASVTCTRKKNNLQIFVDAQDAVALRSMCGAITKVLAIQKKMDEIK